MVSTGSLFFLSPGIVAIGLTIHPCRVTFPLASTNDWVKLPICNSPPMFVHGGDDEDNARLKKFGLWGGSHKPIAPWNWRKMGKDERHEIR